MSNQVKRILKSLKFMMNIVILLSALLLGPLFLAAQFLPSLQGFISQLAANHLSHPTVSDVEKKKLTKAKGDNKALRKNNRKLAKLRAENTHIATRKITKVGKRGTKILIRGSSAILVGAIPFVGFGYDVYAMGADYSDVCDLVEVIDELSGLLNVESGLYNANYCDKRDAGFELFMNKAQEDKSSEISTTSRLTPLLRRTDYDFNQMANNEGELDAYCRGLIQDDLGDRHVKKWKKLVVKTAFDGQRAYHVVYEPAVKWRNPRYSCLLTESAPYIGERLSDAEVSALINENEK